MQSVPTRANLPGFEAENRNPLLGDVEARVWIGTAGIVAAHHDPSENIACAVAGKRRFTLFAPDQVGNLYMGPYELTPAGATISMVDFDAPDYERFPKFKDALEMAVYADLEPGDAIYIPLSVVASRALTRADEHAGQLLVGAAGDRAWGATRCVPSRHDGDQRSTAGAP